MRTIGPEESPRIAGRDMSAPFAMISATDVMLAQLSTLPPIERSKLLAQFTPEALHKELQREASPTAGILSESFFGDYSVAIVESRVGASQEPVICVGQPGEEEDVVWEHSGAPYSYEVD